MAKKAKIDKQQRFEKLAEQRTRGALKKMRLIGNLANRHNYSYTEEHAKQIIDALEVELRELKGKFKREAGSPAREFSFRK